LFELAVLNLPERIYNAPAFRYAFLLIAGIITGRYLIFNPFIIAALIIICFGFYYTWKKNIEITDTIILSVIIVLAGVIKSNFDFHLTETKSLKNYVHNHTDILLTGVIDDLPEVTQKRIRFTLNSEKIISADDTLEVSGRVLVQVKGKKNINPGFDRTKFGAGDRVTVFGDLVNAPEESNPGEFNYREFLELNDIYKLFKVSYYDDVVVLDKGNLGFFYQNIIYPARKYTILKIRENAGENESAFLNGLVTGYRGDFSNELKEDFIKAGVMHLIAVSGLNVAYIIIFFTLVLTLFRVPLKPRIFVIIIFLVFYCFFTGLPASIIRAAVMGSLVLLSFIIQRRVSFLNIVGFSAMVILLFDARQLFTSGFILSYTAVLSMVIILETAGITDIEVYEGKNKKFRKALKYIFLTLSTTVAAQIGVLPITALYFSKVSVIAVFTNVIAIPLSNLSLALGFVQLILGIFSGYLASLVAVTNNFLLHLQLEFINYSASFDYGYFEVYTVGYAFVFVYYIALVLLITVNKINYKFRVVFVVMLISLLAVYSSIFNYTDNLRATYLSLGNANCTHIRTPDNSNILIDVGYENYYNHSNSYKVIPYLRRQGVSEIDLLILTRPVGKNYRAVDNVLKNFRVNRIILTGTDDNIHGSNAEIFKIYDVKDINGFGNVDIKFIGEDAIQDEGFAIKVSFGNKTFLFPNFMDSETEKIFIRDYGQLINADVLKVQGYGTSKFTTPELLGKVTPEISVISTAGIKDRNMPSKEVLTNLRSFNSSIYRTDIDNAVILETDGDKIEKVSF
jgi:competence protein ComEC